jgi:hypothetical protein
MAVQPCARQNPSSFRGRDGRDRPAGKRGAAWDEGPPPHLVMAGTRHSRVNSAGESGEARAVVQHPCSHPSPLRPPRIAEGGVVVDHVPLHHWGLPWSLRLGAASHRARGIDQAGQSGEGLGSRAYTPRPLCGRGGGMEPSKTQQKPAFRPLTITQENAIEWLILGKSDREVADAIGVNRMTVQSWRTSHAVFMAELNRRRQALWTDAHEKLRSLVSSAIDRLHTELENGALTPAALLRLVGLAAAVPAPAGDTDPEAIIAQQAKTQVAREGVPETDLESYAGLLQNPTYRRRLAEVKEGLAADYLEPAT